MQIPKTIHRIWIGDPEPNWLREFGDSWRTHHPDWSHLRWTDRVESETDRDIQSLMPLDNHDIWEQAERWVDRGHLYQLKSDLLRYTILNRFGGLYVDADFLCLKPIDPLVKDLRCFAAWELEGMWAANGLLGSTPAHPFIQAVIAGISKQVHKYKGHKVTPTKLTGPQYITAVVREVGGCTMLPQRNFFPYGYRDVRLHKIDEDFSKREELFAVHVWHNRRRKLGMLDLREVE